MQDFAISKYHKNHEKIQTINMSYLGEDLFNDTKYCIRFAGKEENQNIEEETLLIEEFFSKNNQIKKVRKIVQGKKILSWIVIERDFSDVRQEKSDNFSLKTLVLNFLEVIQKTLSEAFFIFSGNEVVNFSNIYCVNSILSKNNGKKTEHKSKRVHGSYLDEIYLARVL